MLAAALAVTALTCPVRAELTRDDGDAIENLFDGKLYARIDLPCRLGRQPFGAFKIPMVEASPRAVRVLPGEAPTRGEWHEEAPFWGVLPNDVFEFDDADIDGTTVEIEVKGVGLSRGKDTVVRFVKIDTLADLERAAALVFSRRPLQEEHPDWPSEIRAAIASRLLRAGMTPEQARCVTGDPLSVEARDEGGRRVEIWRMRSDRGVKIGFFGEEPGASPEVPSALKFVDGRLEGWLAPETPRAPPRT